MSDKLNHKFKTALEHFAKGKMIIVVDDFHRENEGDLIVAADFLTPDHINFMATYGRGLICAPITQETANRLELPLMPARNTDGHDTAFTYSVDARVGIHTGISAFDRALTIKKLNDAKSISSEFMTPGHIFPLIAKDGGLQVRRGHTEAAIDLCLMSGLNPCSVICEIMCDDGTMACGERLEEFALRHNLPLISIEEILEYQEYQKNNFLFKSENKNDYELKSHNLH
ncbi:MAG: 3,4-dihydroxy-2-butanone-4-phosphate synthase [Bacteriovoracaceae bacterium]|nr:3,4-dihydroxy-2-butanone-4-phosphate synthase [Bacteriovoracaceae bacterium]